MKNVSIRFRLLALLLLCLGGLKSVALAGYDDRQGHEWRQPRETSGLAWSQVSVICPQTGATPCKGTIGLTDFNDWIWATAPQVKSLFGLFVPEILTSPTASVGGYQYFVTAGNFLNIFAFTGSMKGCPTYQPCFNFQMVAGVTASVDSSGKQIKGDVFLDLENQGGSFSVDPMFVNNDTSSGRGSWLWRHTGLYNGKVYAYNDVGTPPTPAGGKAVNVLANDWNAGARASPDNVKLNTITAMPAGITLNSFGDANVAAGTPIGIYPFKYRICSLAFPTKCDPASVTITVRSFPIVAVNDQATAAFASGGTPVSNVLANDKLGGLPATTAAVTLQQVSSTHAGITLNLDGSVSIAPGTPSGTHSLAYQICERASPINCAQATLTLTPNSIDAVNDLWRLSSKLGGSSPSVLVNDWFSNIRATTDKVSISLVSPLLKGMAFNTSTGVFSIAPKTSSGDYPIIYKICEIANPTNCDSATATLELTGSL